MHQMRLVRLLCLTGIGILLILLFCWAVRAEEPPPPTPVTITEDDVAELRAANRQERLERSIRDDLEWVENWSDDNDD